MLPKKIAKTAPQIAVHARRIVATRSAPPARTAKTVPQTVEHARPLMVVSPPTAQVVEAVIVSNVSASRMHFAATPNGMESA